MLEIRSVVDVVQEFAQEHQLGEPALEVGDDHKYQTGGDVEAGDEQTTACEGCFVGLTFESRQITPVAREMTLEVAQGIDLAFSDQTDQAGCHVNAPMRKLRWLESECGHGVSFRMKLGCHAVPRG